MTTTEEYQAKAMLLGMASVHSNVLVGKKVKAYVFRKRVGDGHFHGCALFSYFDADTLEPIEGMQERSEVDL